MRLGKVVIDVGYVVDLDNEGMVQHAKDSLYEDIMNAVKYGEVDNWITITKSRNLKESDIPEFLIQDDEEEQIVEKKKPSHVAKKKKPKYTDYWKVGKGY